MEYFTTREIALGIWILIFIVFCCAVKNLRKTLKNALFDIFRTLKFKYIILPFILLLGYGVFWVWLFHKTVIWDVTYLKDIIIWILFAGVPLCFTAVSNETKPDYFKNALIDALKVTVLVEFIVSTYTFHLAIELILVPVIFFCLLGSIIGKQENIKKVYIILTTIIGIIIVISSIVLAIQHYEDFGEISTWVSFAIPIALTLLFLPIAYIFAVISQYEQILIKLKLLMPNNVKLRRKRSAHIFKVLRFSLRKLVAFRTTAYGKLYIDMTEDEFKAVIDGFV